MTAREYALESMMYRTAGLIDARIEATPTGRPTTAGRCCRRSRSSPSKRRSPRCWAARSLDYIIDENVQIHGGNGFVRDYPAEGHYRDSRVNRIFEGTNEINRLLIPGMLMKKALKGDLPLIAAAKQLQDEIMSPSMALPEDDDGVLGDETRAVRRVQEGGADGRRHGDAALRREARQEQEVLSYLADILIDTYAAESAVLRAQAAAADASGRTPICTPMLRGSTSTRRRAASSSPRAAAWRRWPRATCCARSWRRCGAC